VAPEPPASVSFKHGRGKKKKEDTNFRFFSYCLSNCSIWVFDVERAADLSEMVQCNVDFGDLKRSTWPGYPMAKKNEQLIYALGQTPRVYPIKI
jgi:hypothetical protein